MALKSKFCPRCGKEVTDLKDNLCADCYISSYKPSIPRSVSIKYCPVCKSVLMRNVWIAVSEPPEIYLEKKIAEKIKLAPLEKLRKVKILKTGKEGEIKIVTELDGKKYERVLKGTPTVDKYACPECSRQFKTSITAIIQLRCTGDAKKFVNEALGLMGRTKRKIVKADERLHGIDLSFSDKRTARVLARRFKDHFKCTMKESVKQRGWDRSKERPLVQNTYLLRCKR